MLNDKAIVVQKYGGSSVASLDKLRRVAQRVTDARAKGYHVVVVVSAMGDTTDELFQMAQALAAQPPRRELDMLLSAGERITMALLSMAIQERGAEAISLTGSQSGILTNDRHFDARIIEVRPIRIQDELDKDKIVIVAGYQGMSYKREITTLGRGGSDTTAVALAAALDADSCEIYSDVDGVYTADPRVVLDAQRLDSLDYHTMEELARSGASVLHAEAVAFAQRRQIVLYARATDGRPGATMVRKDPPPTEESRCAVACLPRIVKFSLTQETALGEVLSWLATQQLTPVYAQWSAAGSQAFFNADEFPALHDKLRATPEHWDVLIKSGLSAVSVVGPAIGQRLTDIQQAHDAIKESLSTTIVGMEVTPLRVSFFVAEDETAEAQRCLHAVFV